MNYVANIKSAKKRILTNAMRTLRNKAINSDLKTVIKKANLAISEKSSDKAEAVKLAVKKIDMAATKGVLSKNTASRKKSSLMRRCVES